MAGMGTRALFGGEGAARPVAKGGKTVHAHCDGGARGNPGPAGYGAMITDEAGAKLAELSEYLGKRTNNYAEYSGLLGVLQWSLDNGVANLRVVSDSELMVKQVQGKYKVNSPDLRPLFEEARRRIGRLESFQITHALRHKNKDADRLANEAMDRGMGKAPASGSSPVPRGASLPGRTHVPEGRGVHASASSAVSAAGSGRSASGAVASATAGSRTAAPAAAGGMMRGFVRDGVIHLLGGKTLPDGSFVKVIAE